MEEIERLRTNLSGIMTEALSELNRMADNQFEDNVIESVCRNVPRQQKNSKCKSATRINKTKIVLIN